MRTAQLAVDLEIDGAAVLYSWPSRASLLSYVIDRNQKVAPYIEELKALIAGVAKQTGAAKLHVVAHSLGSDFLLDALREVNTDRRGTGDTTAWFREIIFAAPDVDVEDFNSRVQKVRDLAQRITVYCSEKDRALRWSEWLNGGPRAGSAAHLVVSCGGHAIDTTEAAQSWIGHTNFATTAIDDVRAVVWLPVDFGPDRRNAILRPDEVPAGRFWRFIFEEPRGQDGPFRVALVWARRLSVPKALETIANNIKVAGSDPARARLRLVESQLRQFLS
jgi:hypothetical protein